MPGWINRENFFTAISLAVAAIFGWGFFKVAGFPPTKVDESWQLLVVLIVFLFVPFAKKLDFFQFFSFEAKVTEIQKEVGETKQKVSDVREDVRHVIAQQNALSATFHSMNHQAVTVNNYERPPQEQVEAATAEVANVEPIQLTDADPLDRGLSPEDKLMRAIFGDREDAPPIETNRSLAELFIDIDDINEIRKLNISERAALLRIRIERELKRLLRPHASELWAGIRPGRRLSMPPRELVRAAMELHPELSGQRESFDVFFRIANSAVHADEVPYKDLEAAIYLGERLLGLLTKTQPHDPQQPAFPFGED